jgi:hypothetical protein
MFGRLWGPRFFNSLKRPLACKQASLPIAFGGISFIPTTPIAPRTYLWSWAFIVFIIIIKFMVDQHPFLIKALA